MCTKRESSRRRCRFRLSTLLYFVTFWIPSIGYVNAVNYGSSLTLKLTFDETIRGLSIRIASALGMDSFDRHIFLVEPIRQLLNAVVIGLTILLMVRTHSRMLTSIAFAIPAAIPAWHFAIFGVILSPPFTWSFIIAWGKAAVIPLAMTPCLLFYFIYEKSRLEHSLPVDGDTNTRRRIRTIKLAIFGVYLFLCIFGWHDLIEFRARWEGFTR